MLVMSDADFTARLFLIGGLSRIFGNLIRCSVNKPGKWSFMATHLVSQQEGSQGDAAHEESQKQFAFGEVRWEPSTIGPWAFQRVCLI